MSVVVTVTDGTTSAVPLGAAGTVAELIDVIREVLELPHPAGAYEVRVGGGDDAEDVSCRGDAALAEVGLHGCEEQVKVQVKYSHVAREQLAPNVVTQAEARRALQRAIAADEIERVRLIAAADLTPLKDHVQAAIKTNKASIAEAMLAVSGERDGLDDHFRLACKHNKKGASLGLLKVLVDLGADVNKKETDGSTVLHRAAYAGDKDLVETLLVLGADVNAWQKSKPPRGGTPLHNTRGYTEVMKVLAKHGADLNAKRTDGITLLQYGVNTGIISITSTLVELGADVHIRYPDGRTLLETASGSGDWTIIKAILGGGANVDERDADGCTSLHRVCARGFREAAMVLLDHGADINATQPDGAAPLQLARLHGFNDLADLLVGRGAYDEDTEDAAPAAGEASAT